MPKHDEPTSEPSLPGFIKWLESKDPNERYEWLNADICACGQYARSLGKDEWVGYPGWNKLNSLARGDILIDHHAPPKEEQWTFGGLLARCKEVAN